MKRYLACALLVVAVSGCEKQVQLPSKDNEGGRFAFYPPTGDMPAILLDTKTGCMGRLIKLTAVDNPKQVSWVRQYLDGSLPDVDYAGSQPEAIPGSGPPQHCPAHAKALKK